MDNQRKSDFSVCTRSRNNRFFKDNNRWYFSTREGDAEGPFDSMREAERELKNYKTVLASGFMPRDSSLPIQPLD